MKEKNLKNLILINFFRFVESVDAAAVVLDAAAVVLDIAVVVLVAVAAAAVVVVVHQEVLKVLICISICVDQH